MKTHEQALKFVTDIEQRFTAMDLDTVDVSLTGYVGNKPGRIVLVLEYLPDVAAEDAQGETPDHAKLAQMIMNWLGIVMEQEGYKLTDAATESDDDRALAVFLFDHNQTAGKKP